MASKHYEVIWNDRSNYDSKYAITSREKAQLEMLALSKDKNKTMEEIVESIARKAAPRNSTVDAYSTYQGIQLDVNFDMSKVTTGEYGTRTKHDTIKSLKKETVRLISKVTTDIYEFCKDLELENIAIGCRHYVSVEDYLGSSYKENLIIFKVGLDRKNVKSLERNPFLDIYAITKYLQVEEDNFPTLRIEKSL